MHRYRSLLATVVAAALLTLTAAAAPATPTRHQRHHHHGKARVHHVKVCKARHHHKRHRHRARCFAIRVDRGAAGRTPQVTAPLGYGPGDLQAAYDLPSATAGSGETLAIVDAYDDPTAERDLAVYRAQYGLPACTTANGCFRKVDQNGGGRYPESDAGWSQEMSLDLDMASAVCPNCGLLLVEAETPAMKDLGLAVDTAVRLGATVVSNSYGGADASDRSYGRYYHHPGVAVTASTGDNGYGVSYPASSQWVTAVGGTSLEPVSGGYHETAWGNSGSGCSTENRVGWQPESTTGCAGRAVADVAAVADPGTGVAVYDTDSYQGTSGWLTFGGTSAAAPIIAGVYALAGNATQVRDGSYVWAHHGGLRDVTSGSNGSCPTPQWCTAGTGWDGPTGWGTPQGVAAF